MRGREDTIGVSERLNTSARDSSPATGPSPGSVRAQTPHDERRHEEGVEYPRKRLSQTTLPLLR